jgi:hypothetical protein
MGPASPKTLKIARDSRPPSPLYAGWPKSDITGPRSEVGCPRSEKGNGKKERGKRKLLCPHTVVHRFRVAPSGRTTDHPRQTTNRATGRAAPRRHLPLATPRPPDGGRHRSGFKALFWAELQGAGRSKNRSIHVEPISKIRFQGIRRGSGGIFFCVLNPAGTHRSLSASTVLAEAGRGNPQQFSVCRHAAKLLVSF